MASIGTVIFEGDLKWIPKNGDVSVLGSDTRTRDGSIVSIRGPKAEEFRTYRFGRITNSDWQVLKRMAEGGARFPFTPENGGPTYDARFAVQNPLVITKYNEDDDLIIEGEIRLIVPAR